MAKHSAFIVVTLNDGSHDTVAAKLTQLKRKDSILSFLPLGDQRGFLVSYDGICKQLSDLLEDQPEGEPDQKPSTVILNLSHGGYHGHAPCNIWEWLQVYYLK